MFFDTHQCIFKWITLSLKRLFTEKKEQQFQALKFQIFHKVKESPWP